MGRTWIHSVSHKDPGTHFVFSCPLGCQGSLGLGSGEKWRGKGPEGLDPMTWVERMLFAKGNSSQIANHDLSKDAFSQFAITEQSLGKTKHPHRPGMDLQPIHAEGFYVKVSPTCCTGCFRLVGT